MPKFNDVFLAFQEFQNAQIRALRDPASFEEKFVEAKNDLKAKLDAMGVGQNIDWSE